MAMREIASKLVAVGIILATIAITTGCGGFMAYRNLNRDLTALVGQDIHVVIKKLGYPTSQAIVAGDKVYAWEDNGCTIHARLSTALSTSPAMTSPAATTTANGSPTDWINDFSVTSDGT